MNTPNVPVFGTIWGRVSEIFDRRFANRPSWVVLAQLFLAIGWLRSAAAKVPVRDWWTGQTVEDFITDNESQTVGWYEPIVDIVIANFDAGWAAVVLVLEITIGVALLMSVRVGPALTAGIFLNLNFLLIGAPNPSIFYLLLQLGIALWMLESVTTPAIGERTLRVMIGIGVGLTLLCLPFIRTLDPALVIDDPASVLATWSFCGTAAATVALRRVHREIEHQQVIDVRPAEISENVAA